MTFLYILLFIFCLSTLVMVHELGHLLTAKMFKVYCFEYAIGFGPKLFSFKRKKGETAFSLRAIPFGGFVSMYGEKESVPEGLEIDPSRSLLNIKKWKRCIIMIAGITMNIILSFILFFVCEVAYPYYQGHYAHISVDGGSIAAEAGLKEGDFVKSVVASYNGGGYIFYDESASLTYMKYTDPEDTITGEVFFGYSYSTLSLNNTSLKDHSVAFDKVEVNHLAASYTNLTLTQIYEGAFSEDTNYLVSGYVYARGRITKDDKEYQRVILSEYYELYHPIVIDIEVVETNRVELDHLPASNYFQTIGTIKKNGEKDYSLSTVSNNYAYNYPNFEVGNRLAKKSGDYVPKQITFHMDVIDEEHHTSSVKTFTNIPLTYNESNDVSTLPNNIGIHMQLEAIRNTYGQAVEKTFKDFGESSLLIYKTIGSLFTDANTWKDVGGIIAIGVVTTRTLQQYGFRQYLYFWAVISVNLAIVNLMPFPGLDGWQLLVTIVEGVFKKEIPSKVKNWFSIVGIALLFGLMIIIIIKDVITFI